MSRENNDSKPSVLLRFQARNVRSFKEEVELSLLSTAMAEKHFVREVPLGGGGRSASILPVAGVFGANASGKSNLLRVMDDMRKYVLLSFRSGDPDGGLPRWPFRLDKSVAAEPSEFEIDLVLDGVRHRYGFALDDERILWERAHWYPQGRSALLFHRTGDKVALGSTERAKGRATLELLRPNALYLSTAASINHPVLLPLYRWFQRNLNLAEAESRPFRQAITTEMLGDGKRGETVLQLLWAADLGIVGARREEPDPVMQERMRRALPILMGVEGKPESEELPVPAELAGTILVHRGASGDVELNAEEESHGTRVWFGLVGPVLQALESGAVLLADELDVGLHFSLVEQFIRLFQSPKTNPHRAQLVFNTHDTTLMGDSAEEPLLGRDQIWFTEKNDDGGTRLYPLTDFKPRKQEAVAQRYRRGRYGAVPILMPGGFEDAAEQMTTPGS